MRAISAEISTLPTRPGPSVRRVASRRRLPSRSDGPGSRYQVGSSLVVGFGFGFDLLVIHGIMFIYSTFTLCVL